MVANEIRLCAVPNFKTAPNFNNSTMNTKKTKVSKSKKALHIADVSNSVCKCGGKFEYIDREGYVCKKCGWTKLFAN